MSELKTRNEFLEKDNKQAFKVCFVQQIIIGILVILLVLSLASCTGNKKADKAITESIAWWTVTTKKTLDCVEPEKTAEPKE